MIRRLIIAVLVGIGAYVLAAPGLHDCLCHYRNGCPGPCGSNYLTGTVRSGGWVFECLDANSNVLYSGPVGQCSEICSDAVFTVVFDPSTGESGKFSCANCAYTNTGAGCGISVCGIWRCPSQAKWTGTLTYNYSRQMLNLGRTGYYTLVVTNGTMNSVGCGEYAWSTNFYPVDSLGYGLNCWIGIQCERTTNDYWKIYSASAAPGTIGGPRIYTNGNANCEIGMFPDLIDNYTSVSNSNFIVNNQLQATGITTKGY